MVGRDAAAHPLNADGVQAGQGDGEAIPELLLKLRQHALHRQHQNATPAPAGDELAHQDAGFQRLAESHGIGNQDALTGPREGQARRVELVVHEIHGSGVPDVDVLVVGHRMAKLALHVQDAVGEPVGLVRDEMGVRGIEHLDGGLQRGEEDGFAAPHQLGNAFADDLVAAGGVIHAADDPLRVAHDDAGSGSGD